VSPSRNVYSETGSNELARRKDSLIGSALAQLLNQMGHKTLEIHSLKPDLLPYAVADNSLLHDQFDLTCMGNCLQGTTLNVLRE